MHHSEVSRCACKTKSLVHLAACDVSVTSCISRLPGTHLSLEVVGSFLAQSLVAPTHLLGSFLVQSLVAFVGSGLGHSLVACMFSHLLHKLLARHSLVASFVGPGDNPKLRPVVWLLGSTPGQHNQH